MSSNIVIDLGTDKDSPSKSDIFATKKDITRNEFFLAKQAGLKPALFVEIRSESYGGEEYLWHNGKRYKIYRTHERVDYWTELYAKEL